MIRIKRGNIARSRRKKYLKLAKGYTTSNSKLSTFASEQIVQSFYFNYIGRKLKKRTYRKFWIYRINILSRMCNNLYSKLVGSLIKLNILLNRKILAFLAFHDLVIFNLLTSLSKF